MGAISFINGESEFSDAGLSGILLNFEEATF